MARYLTYGIKLISLCFAAMLAACQTSDTTTLQVTRDQEAQLNAIVEDVTRSVRRVSDRPSPKVIAERLRQEDDRVKALLQPWQWQQYDEHYRQKLVRLIYGDVEDGQFTRRPDLPAMPPGLLDGPP